MMEPTNNQAPRKVGSLKERSLKAVKENFGQIFYNHDDLELEIPKSLRKEIVSSIDYFDYFNIRDFIKLCDAQTMELIDFTFFCVDVEAGFEFDDVLCEKLGKFVNFTFLVLPVVVKLKASPKALCRMFSKMKKLEFLEVLGSNFDDVVLKTVAENCNNLKRLMIFQSGITDEGLSCLANSAIRLEELKIGDSDVTFVGMQKLMNSPTCETLQAFDFFGDKIIKSLFNSSVSEFEDPYEEYVNWIYAVWEGGRGKALVEESEEENEEDWESLEDEMDDSD